MTGLLLEGIPATGTWDIILHLQEHPVWRRRETKLVLSEYYTERANDHLRSRTAESYRVLMQRSLRVLQAIGQVESASPLFDPEETHDLCYVLERFHLTNALTYADGLFDTYRDIDLELSRLSCRLALITVNDMMIEPRLADVASRRDKRWRERQERLAHQVGDLTRHYGALQRSFREAAAASALEHIVVDATDGDWWRCVGEILRFWRI